MHSLVLATALLAGTETLAQGCSGFSGCAGFQPYYFAPPSGPFCTPWQQPGGFAVPYAVPVGGGAWWRGGTLTQPNPWVMPGGTASPSDESEPTEEPPPMKRAKDDETKAALERHGDRPGREPATVVVLAARDAVVVVNGKTMPRRAERETYPSPPLEVGRRYDYLVTVTLERDGEPVRQTRRIEVEAGRRTEVDFRSLAMDRTPAKTLPPRRTAEVTLVVAAGTKVRINGQPLPMVGRQRFHTPALEPGQQYRYTVEAEVLRNGKAVTQTRSVGVEAGKAVLVDFTVAQPQ